MDHKNREADKASDDVKDNIKVSDKVFKDEAGIDSQKAAADLVKGIRKEHLGKHVLTKPGQESFKLTDDGKPITAPKDEPEGKKDQAEGKGKIEQAAPATKYEDSVDKARALTYLTTNFDSIDAAGKGKANGRISEKDIDAFIEKNKSTLGPKELQSLEYAKKHIGEIEQAHNDWGRDKKGISKGDLTETKGDTVKEVSAERPKDIADDAKKFADAFEAAKKSGNYDEVIKDYKKIVEKYSGDSEVQGKINDELHKRGLLPSGLSIDTGLPELMNKEMPGLPIRGDKDVNIYDKNGKPVDATTYSATLGTQERLPGKDIVDAEKQESARESKDDTRIKKDVDLAVSDFAKGDYAKVIKDFEAEVKKNPGDVKVYAQQLTDELQKKGILPPSISIDAFALKTVDTQNRYIPITDGTSWTGLYGADGKNQMRNAAPIDIADTGLKKEDPKNSKPKRSGIIDPFELDN